VPAPRIPSRLAATPIEGQCGKPSVATLLAYRIGDSSRTRTYGLGFYGLLRVYEPSLECTPMRAAFHAFESNWSATPPFTRSLAAFAGPPARASAEAGLPALVGIGLGVRCWRLEVGAGSRVVFCTTLGGESCTFGHRQLFASSDTEIWFLVWHDVWVLASNHIVSRLLSLRSEGKPHGLVPTALPSKFFTCL
jgi:hypothetical protein